MRLLIYTMEVYMSKMTMSDAGKLGYIKSEATHKRNKQNRIEKYECDPKRCRHCNGAIPYNKRENAFCNHTCSAIYNNNLKNKKEKVCIHCGTIIRDYKFWQTRKYCSSKCQADYRWEGTKKQFAESGVMPCKRTAKRYLAEVHGKKCSICDTNEWMGRPILLILDHIDGNATNCRVDNLRLICSNCDAQLPTYKGCEQLP